uniref:Uncharacterized protein n=1 Tax=uncultured marine virus TaxID=186617 RepID=A0A0F7L6L6_9VIRU|nr:hypothetical protein [uncultured marine virus]
MANIVTHSLSFKKEDILQYFVDIAYNGEDLTPMMTVLTDVKGTQTLHDISRPSNITKASSVGFSGVGSLTLTNRDITVKALKAEFEQNGEAFVGSWTESALASGYSLDDVNNMTALAFFNQIVLPLIAQAIAKDKNRMVWHCDTKQEAMTGTAPDRTMTGAADADNNVYTGLWTHFFNDFAATTIPADQKLTLSNAGVAKVYAITLASISAGSISLTVNGTAYTEAFHTDSATTVTNWHTSHKATIEARGGYTSKLTITDDASAKLTFTANHKGGSFTVALTSAGTSGTWTANTNTVAVIQPVLGTDIAQTTMGLMLDGIPEEALDHENDMIFLCTRSWARNYLASLKGEVLESSFRIMQNGQKVLQYEGHDVITVALWDEEIKNLNNAVYKHRCVLTTKKNLLFATDGASDDKAVETWYNTDAEMRRFRVKYRAQTAYKYSGLIVLAF